MKNFKSFLALTTLVIGFGFSSNRAAAQPPGMGDPAQMAQMQVDALRDSLGVTNKDDWSVISPLLTKVIQLKSQMTMADMSHMMAPMMARMGGGPGGPGGGMNPFGGQPDPFADALQKTLDDNAHAAEIKAALAKFRESNKQKRAELTKAQDALQAVLSSRQEAILAVAGYLE